MLVELSKELNKPKCVCPRCTWEQELWLKHVVESPNNSQKVKDRAEVDLYLLYPYYR